MPVVERCTVGTVGEPGKRVFYFQARAVDRTVTLKMEKQQVEALAEYMEKLVEEMPPSHASLIDLELEEPVEAIWAVGPIGVAYDNELDRVMVEAQERLTEESMGEPAVARFFLTREQASAFAARGTALVSSGRPPCPHCGHPFDAEHVCPKTNGHKPPGP